MKTKKTLNDFLIWLKCSGLLTVYFETINNPAIGIGMNGTFFENYGIFTGKLSWEYSTKLRISTSYAPVNSYQSFNRFAIVYHF